MRQKCFLCFLCLLLLVFTTAGAEKTLSNESGVYTGSSTIILNVDSTMYHSVCVQCGEHGTIEVEGNQYTGTAWLSLYHLGSMSIRVIPDIGYQWDSIIASTDTGLTVDNDIISLQELNGDITILLGFAPVTPEALTIVPQAPVLARSMSVQLYALWDTGIAPDSVCWSSDDPSVAVVSNDGLVTAKADGSTIITAKAGDLRAQCTVTVRDLRTMKLPKAMKHIGDEAMLNDTTIEAVILPDGTLSIGSRAFKGASALRFITIPATVDTIGEDAFNGCSDLIILCDPASTAEDYAVKHNILHQFR